jgi:hypothetical protein
MKEGLLAASLLAGANWADYRTTQQALARCTTCFEANPLIGREGERLAPVKLASAALETWAFLELRKKGKKRAWAFVAGVVGVNLALAAHNRSK